MDHVHGSDFIFTKYAKKLISVKARQLHRRRDFQSTEKEDLQQELWLALLKAADQFDPAKASVDTFIDRVVNSAVAMLVRARECPTRSDGFFAKSLDRELVSKSETPEPLATAIGPGDVSRRTGYEVREETLRREDDDAFHYALAEMPGYMRDICRRYMGGSIAAAAAEAGLSRRQVRQIIAEAKPFFEQVGIDF